MRPIVLLSALRKTLSLIVLSRNATKVDNFLSPSQSGFRRGRSTADVVFGYRWLCAKAQRQRITIEFLCIDLSRAFDTIRRDKLLEVLQSFLDEPELRMIRFLLAATSLEPVYPQETVTPSPPRLVLHRVTAWVRCCLQSTWKQSSATFVHAFRLDPQPMTG